MLPDHDGYSEDYLENTELNRGIFLSFNLGDQALPWMPFQAGFPPALFQALAGRTV